jgi:hypothetical protein
VVRTIVGQHELRVNGRTDSHTLQKGLNGFVSALSVFLDRCGLNLVQEIPRSAAGRF